MTRDEGVGEEPRIGVPDASSDPASLRAMILAAGLGTRMRPLTDHRAKPALPVLGRPVISLLLAWLARHGVREVLVNLHHLPDSIRAAVARDRPAGLEITWSEESEPLGTGGGIERAAAFLRGADDCLVLAGDMLLDLDLGRLLDAHRASGRDVTLVLRDDPRAAHFGSIGVDADGAVVRIGERVIDGAGSPDASESARGLFTSLRFLRRGALKDWPAPPGDAFEDLRDWLAPRVARGALRLGAEIVGARDSVWEPVGTPAEYLAANLSPPVLSSLGGAPEAWAGTLRRDLGPDTVVDAAAEIGENVRLERCVVWDDARVPAGFRGRDGVYAEERFHSCGEETSASRTDDPADPDARSVWDETVSGSTL